MSTLIVNKNALLNINYVVIFKPPKVNINYYILGNQCLCNLAPSKNKKWYNDKK